MKSTLLAFFYVTLVFTQHSQAQNKKSISSGSITGQVVNCGDDVIPDAIVILKNKKIHRKVITDEGGYFQFEVPSGKYELIVEPPSILRFFSKFRDENIEVESDSGKTFKITLGSMVPMIVDFQ